VIGGLLLLGCTGQPPPTPGEVNEVADYTGLAEGASWVYRDDGLDETPVEDELLRARYQGDGLVELRRGYRWADADPAGSIRWDTSDGLELTALQLGSVSWSGALRLADPEPENGDQQVRGGNHCLTDDAQVVETFYADYDDALLLSCTGDALPGTYAFARGVGLVRLEIDGLTIDLVAPW